MVGVFVTLSILGLIDQTIRAVLLIWFCKTGLETIFLVVECKRVRDAVWLFLRSDGTNQKRSHSQSFVSYFVNNKQQNFNWNNISVDPPTVEALFCAIRGQSTNDNKRNLLERIGGELISATEALAFEEKDFRPSGDTLRFYFNIIITTADLKVAKFLPEDISNGVLNSAVFEDVPFIRFRKQMSTRETHLSQHDYHQRYNLSSSKENTVFIVRADAIVEFLRQFEIPKNTIYQLKSG